MTFEIAGINVLPSLSEIKRKSQALALLDAIFMPEWQYRYFSFNSRWNESKGEMMASMRDGAGDEYFLLLSEHGVAGKVLSDAVADDPLSLLSNMPEIFFSFKTEPAFSLDKASFYFWQDSSHRVWCANPDDLGNYPLLGFLVGDGAYYHGWAEGYYERAIDLKLVEMVFTSLAIDFQQLAVLNPDVTLDDLRADVHEIFGRDW